MILASQEIIRKWTEAGAWGNKTLIDYFKEHVRTKPDKVCLVDPLNKEALVGLKPERLTYRELDRAVDATAEALLAKGIHKDDIIMVQLPNTWELAMLYLAITRTGALISPVPMQWRLSELDYIAGMTDAAAFITVEEFGGFKHGEMAGKIQAKHPSLKQIITLPEIREMTKGEVTGKLDQIRIDPNDVFTLCWSSGTEAEPKGCPLSHNNWLFQSTLCFESAPILPGDNLITAGPLVNMASIGTVFVAWLKGGGKLVLHHPFDGPTFVMQLMIGGDSLHAPRPRRRQRPAEASQGGPVRLLQGAGDHDRRGAAVAVVRPGAQAPLGDRVRQHLGPERGDRPMWPGRTTSPTWRCGSITSRSCGKQGSHWKTGRVSRASST